MRCSPFAVTGDFPPMTHPTNSGASANHKASLLVNQSESA
jgi:hypothetical protein